MNAFDVLGDPVRRRIVELLAESDRTAGALTDRIRSEFSVGQPAVSNSLRVLREAGFAQSTPRGSQRVYALEEGALDGVESWLAARRRFWAARLDDLEDALDRASHPPSSDGADDGRGR
jgi:DNA-binding transcriptional ArsR family regulator